MVHMPCDVMGPQNVMTKCHNCFSKFFMQKVHGTCCYVFMKRIMHNHHSVDGNVLNGTNINEVKCVKMLLMLWLYELRKKNIVEPYCITVTFVIWKTAITLCSDSL